MSLITPALPRKRSTPIVIGFAGRAHSGKTTCAQALAGALEDKLGATLGDVFSFADPIRDAVDASFPHLPWSTFRRDKDLPIESMPGWTGRKILQHVGTQMRAIDPAVYVKNLEHRLGSGVKYIFVDDVRRDNEAALIRRYGKLYRIERKVADHSPLDAEAAAHESEAFIDSLEVDGVLLNAGSVSELEAVVLSLMPEGVF